MVGSPVRRIYGKRLPALRPDWRSSDSSCGRTGDGCWQRPASPSYDGDVPSAQERRQVHGTEALLSGSLRQEDTSGYAGWAAWLNKVNESDTNTCCDALLLDWRGGFRKKKKQKRDEKLRLIVLNDTQDTQT